MEICTTKKRKIKENLFLCKNYTIILLANFISRFGDSIDSIAYAWMVYALTGSKVLLGSILAVNALPNIIFAPFVGVLADRLDKKKLVIISFMGRGIIVSLTAVLFLTGKLQVWHLFLFTIINSTFEIIMSPAVMSIMVSILEKDKYLSANSFCSSAYKFAELIGTAVAGVIISFLGLGGAIFIDAATFFTAGVLILFIKLPKEEIVKEKLNIKTYFNDLKIGFSYVKDNKLIRNTIILFAIVNFAFSPIGVTMPVFAKEILKGGVEILSYVGVAISLGTIIGGIVVGKFGKKFDMILLIVGGFFIMGISYALLYLPGNIVLGYKVSVILTVFCFFILGFLVPVVAAPIQSYFMMNTDKKIIGRVSSFMDMITYSAIPIGSALSGVVMEYVSISVIFLIMGTFICLVSVILKWTKALEKQGTV